ncbi:MAG: PQQ-binding-like beta-propeller repeat protein [Woeseia sp.]|nr:PQQ-binding-like beta-propeller repeat protein [Woeseia sp.]MBT8097111.1 PQQ-binding-like beta-propeller repeat protein [Woeseia sp.]NNE59825.1 PQQ-binding-like beta-propeller repeat protein [Woeseia sp.]
MLMTNTKFKNLLAAAAFSLLVGSPALADDTELLLYTPDVNNAPQPNVMFILDSSGSMDSLEETEQPYDPAVEFAGDCDTGSVYWTTTDSVPDCLVDDKAAIGKDDFNCASALGPLNAFGTYTDLMAQYRKDDATGLEFWQQIEYDNDRDPVECANDSGVQGEGDKGMNGEKDPGVWYASALTDDDEWTNVAALEVSWGSAPRNVTYTVYDGNYLNWQQDPPTVELSRNEIMRKVIINLLNSLDNMNVGLMRFNGNDGGIIIDAIKDLETNRAALVATVDAIPASGNTPLSETMHEAAQYWHGLDGHYAKLNTNPETDTLALQTGSTSLYRDPILDSCAKNFNVLITDGQPTADKETHTLTPTLPGFAALMGRTTCDDEGYDAEGDGMCLDDVTEWLSKADLDPVREDTQNVVTHTIGFNIDLPILEETAKVSGGEYFLADNISTLTAALVEIVASINRRSLSFTAPAVSVNTFNRTQNFNKLYLTMFGATSNVHWPGNLKRYGIRAGQIIDSNGAAAVNPATGFFYEKAIGDWNDGNADGNEVQLGGAAIKLPDPANRVLLTNNGPDEELTVGDNLITPANVNAFTDADFGLTGGAGQPTREELIRWARGEDVKDEDEDPDTTVRYAMGDPLHSQPAAIVYGGTPTNPDTVVYVGTNDGYLHAVDGDTGEELWSYIPFELLSNLAKLYEDPKSQYKNYGIDGNIVPVVKDENNNGIIDGDDYVYIVFGLRRGGTTYYALDVTNKNAPKLKWFKSYDNFGQTWSTPIVTRIDVNGIQNDDNAVLVIGAGYDTVHDSGALPPVPDAAGAGLYFIDLEDGDDLWDAARDGADLNLDTLTRAIPSTIRVLDINGDGFADRMYAADMGGQVLRFDIFNGEGDGNLVTGGVIAQLGNEGNDSPTAASNRRFYTTPDVSLVTDPLETRRFLAISLGSGYRAHPLDTSVDDYFYSLRDPDPFRQLSQDEYNDYDIITHDELVNVAGDVRVELEPADRGWKFRLPDNQAVLSDSTTFNDEVFFVGFTPEVDTSGEECAASVGTNFLYRISVINGDPVVNNLDELLAEEADAARSEKLGQGGIAPAPQILFPGADDPATCEGDACTPPPIGCVGVECFDPGFENLPVRTLWTQDGIQ